MTKIRRAEISDISFLVELEETSFAEHKRVSKRSLIHSITSPRQMVFILEDDGVPLGATFLIRYTHTLRINSIATVKRCQKSGFGSALVQFVCALAAEEGFKTVSLEALVTNHTLVNWYKKRGFIHYATLKGYYGAGQDAVRLKRSV